MADKRWCVSEKGRILRDLGDNLLSQIDPIKCCMALLAKYLITRNCRGMCKIGPQPSASVKFNNGCKPGKIRI